MSPTSGLRSRPLLQLSSDINRLMISVLPVYHKHRVPTSPATCVPRPQTGASKGHSCHGAGRSHSCADQLINLKVLRGYKHWTLVQHQVSKLIWNLLQRMGQCRSHHSLTRYFSSSVMRHHNQGNLHRCPCSLKPPQGTCFSNIYTTIRKERDGRTQL